MKLIKYLLAGLWSMTLTVLPSVITNVPFADAAAVVVPRVNLLPVRIDPFQEGRSYKITATVDEPIICPPSISGPECHVILYMDNPDPTLVSIDPCWVRWDITDWHATRSFQITSIPHYYNIPQKEIIIRPRVIKSGSEYYNGFQPPSIIVKTSPVKTATCSSTGDPHYTTFDGYYWHFYGRGKEWLVRSLPLPGMSLPLLAVQTITHGSGYSRNCALAVLENGNYIMVSVCRGLFESVIRSLNPDITTHPKLLGSNSNYEIKFPSGVSASFQNWGSNANIWITLPAGYYQTGISGLCGNWDGDSNNEGLKYVYSEWQDLPQNFRVMPGDLDLFSISESQIRTSILPLPNDGQQDATCSYVPPKYIAPILNNPDIEDLTELIKGIYIRPPVRENNFISSVNSEIVDDLLIDINTDDLEQIIPEKQPVSSEEYNRLKMLCQDMAKRPELIKCPGLQITKYISDCQTDIEFLPGEEVVQENWLAMANDCQKEILIANQPTNTSQEAANLAIMTLAVDLGRCYGVVCALGSTCNKLNGLCVCADPEFRGPACNIPIDTPPELVGIRPRYMEFNRKPTDPQPILMYIPNTVFLKYVAPNDIVMAYASVDDGTGIARPIISKNCSNIGDGQFACPIHIVITDAQLRNTIIISWNYSVIIGIGNQDWQQANGLPSVIPVSSTSRLIIYTNPCIKCSINIIAKLGDQETCARSANMCFPSGFMPIDLALDNIRGFFGQTCVGVGSNPSPYTNPCLVCNNEDKIIVNWGLGLPDCQVHLSQNQLATKVIEPIGGHIESIIDISPYLKLTSSHPENLVLTWPGIKLEPVIVESSENIPQKLIDIKLVDDCIILPGIEYKLGSCRLSLIADLILPFVVDGYIIVVVNIYSNYTDNPVDGLKINVKVINNLDNDPATYLSTITEKPILTTGLGPDDTQQTPTTTRMPGPETVNTIMPSTTATNTNTITKSRYVCEILECQEGCYVERSQVSGCILACFCQQTRPSDDPNEPITDYDSAYSTTDVLLEIGSSPITRNSETTNEPVIVRSNVDKPDKVSSGGLAGIVVAALLILIIMLIVGYRYRNAPVRDINPSIINSGYSNGLDTPCIVPSRNNSQLYVDGKNDIKNNDGAFKFGMTANPIYMPTYPLGVNGSPSSKRGNDIFSNPSYVVHNNPLFIESNESLINPLYDSLYTFDEGTYKFVGVPGNDMRLFIKGKDDVVIYDVAYDACGNRFSLAGCNNPVYFSSVVDLSNYYSDPATLDISPLECRLTRLLPSGTYNSGDLYIFNNVNIKNIAVSGDP